MIFFALFIGLALGFLLGYKLAIWRELPKAFDHISESARQVGPEAVAMLDRIAAVGLERLRREGTE